MRKIIIGLAGGIVGVVVTLALTNLTPYGQPSRSIAADPTAGQAEYLRGKVTDGQSTSQQQDQTAYATINETLTVRLLDGPLRGRSVNVAYSFSSRDAGIEHVRTGSVIVLSHLKTETGDAAYSFVEYYRFPSLIWLLAGLVVISIVVARWRGLSSIAGLLISVLVLALFIIPGIMSSGNALLICVEGAVPIIVASLFLAHGFNRRTTVAVLSSLVMLAVLVATATFAIWLAHLTGLTGESEALRESASHINLAGILLGGIIIASLGVLDDVTAGQAAAIDELYKANNQLGLGELYRRGLSIGREHIASLINTLALAYAGVSLPLIILYAVYNGQPLLVIINNEVIADEIVRTIVASICLVLAVPLTTILAAYLLPRWHTATKPNPEAAPKHARPSVPQSR